MVPHQVRQPATEERGPAGWRLLLAWALVLGSGDLAWAQGAGGQGDPAGGADPNSARSTATGRPLVRGQLISRYWLRWTGDESDQDIYETLSLDIGDPDRHAVTGYLLGRLSADLDGGGGSAPFASLDDSFNGRATGHLYDAYADLHRVPGFALLRAGRQMIHDTPELAYFDGLRAETVEIGGIKAQIGAFGGVSTHPFDASPRGDWMTGLYLQGRPWEGGRVRLDWMHLEDEGLLGKNAEDLFGAGVWQTIAEGLELEGQYTRVEGRDRDVRGRVSYIDLGSDLVLQGTYYQLLRTQGDLVLELDPFFSSLLEQFPFRQIGVLAGKGLWEHVDLQAGLDLRRVSDRADVGVFNRDYERYFATTAVHDVAVTGLTISLTADLWDSDGQDVRTWGADVSQRLDDRVTASAGTYYSLYKYDLLLNRERDHVRTYYARVRHKTSASISFDLAYELEDDDFDQYHMMRLGVTWRF